MDWRKAPARIGVMGEDGEMITCPDGKLLKVPFGEHVPNVNELVGAAPPHQTERRQPDGGVVVEMGPPPAIDWMVVCEKVGQGSRR